MDMYFSAALSLAPYQGPLCALPGFRVELYGSTKSVGSVMKTLEASATGNGVHIKSDSVITHDEFNVSSWCGHCNLRMRAVRMLGSVGDKFFEQKPEMSPLLHRWCVSSKGFGKVD